MMHTRSAAPVRPWIHLLLDAAFVVLFAGIGRASHGESVAGTPATAWPFLAGMLLGWLVCRAWRAPGAVAPTGVVVWLVTVAGGMALRLLTGQGAHWSFVLVSLVVTGVFLLGYRALLGLLRR